MTARLVKPLAVTPGNGTGPASTSQLVQTQNAILRSNDSVLGAVNQFREDVTDRFSRMATQLDGVCTEVTTIKGERRTEAALAVERTRNAEKAAADALAAEGKHATQAAAERVDAKETATANNADRQAHSLSRNQRLAITVAAVSAATTMLLSSGFAGLVANVARFLSGG